MAKKPVVFGQQEAKAILEANRELEQMSCFCPACLDWDDANRHYCAICEGEGSVPAWTVIEFFQPYYREAQCKRYLEVMAARGDRTRDTLYALLEQIHQRR